LIRRGAFLALVLAFYSLPGAAADDDVGRQLYESRCAFCHGVDGQGDGVAGKALHPPPTDLSSPDFWQAATTEKVRDAILNGKPGTAMVPFRATLKPDQVDAVVEYVRTFAPK
jgi:mono/diheme cytochrome c family protein